MTKKERKERLVWRLKERPTVPEVSELLTAGIIDHDEARDILFSSETQDDRDKKSLEAEIKFLRQLVENLSESRTQIIEKINKVYVPYKNYDWYQPYYSWTIAGNSAAYSGTLSTTMGGSSGKIGNYDSANYSASDQGLTLGAANFSSIKTF